MRMLNMSTDAWQKLHINMPNFLLGVFNCYKNKHLFCWHSCVAIQHEWLQYKQFLLN